MKIAILGSGYVGLVSGACLSEFGHQVVCIDTDAGKIERLRKGEIPIYEPGLEDLIARNVAGKRLSFSNTIADSADAQAVFIAVGTPTRRGDGHADMTYVYAAAEQIAKSIKDYTVIVTKSTVPVGTSRAVTEIVRKANPKVEFDVASNPEFLREGSAIEDFMHPDRVVIGVSSDRAREVMRQVYRPLFLRETPILFTKLETSELIKYSANAFLAMKITFINQVSDLCEKVGADVHDVARGIGLDGRIGNKFLHPSPGFGGSCFPKDTRALIQTARDAGSPLSLIEATLDFNEARKREMAERILVALGSNPKGKTVAVLGLTFKPNTDDMREAASVTILPILTEKGVHVRAHDPEGMHEAKKQLPNLDYCEDAYDTMKDADVLVILTEWNSYRSLDLDRVKSLLKTPVFMDLRNIYRPDEMAAAGFRYSSLGRSA